MCLSFRGQITDHTCWPADCACSAMLAGFQLYQPEKKQNKALSEDLAQPFVGIKKSLEGLAYFVTNFHEIAEGSEAGNCVACLFYRVAAVIQGAILLVSTALTWLYRIPLRALVTLFASYFE